MTLRRFLLASLALGLAFALWPAGISGPGPETHIAATEAATVPIDTDLQFSFLEEAQYRLWRNGWLPPQACPDPPDFRFLIRMISEDIVVESEWIDEKTGKTADHATGGGLSLTFGSGQTIHEPDAASNAVETK